MSYFRRTHHSVRKWTFTIINVCPMRTTNYNSINLILCLSMHLCINRIESFCCVKPILQRESEKRIANSRMSGNGNGEKIIKTKQIIKWALFVMLFDVCVWVSMFAFGVTVESFKFINWNAFLESPFISCHSSTCICHLTTFVEFHKMPDACMILILLFEMGLALW